MSMKPTWDDLLGGGSLLRNLHSTTNEDQTRPNDGQQVTIQIKGTTLIDNDTSNQNQQNSISEMNETIQLEKLPHMRLGNIFITNQQVTFRAGENEIPTGLDLGVRLSSIGDIVSFRMISRLGYGKFGLFQNNATKTKQKKSTQATDNDTYLVLPNQPIEYEIEILSFGHLRQPIEQMNVEDCISDSLIKSKLGTVAFTRGDYELAVSLYGRAIRFVQPNREVVTQLLLDTYVKIGTNLVIGFSKTNQKDREIIKLCRSILSVDEKATKAWYQLGCALRRMLEYDESRVCLDKVLALDAHSNAAKKEIEKLQRDILKYKKKEKKMYNQGGDIFLKANQEEEKEKLEKLEKEKQKAAMAVESNILPSSVKRRKGNAVSNTGSKGSKGIRKKEDEKDMIKGEGEEEREFQPSSLVCKRGTQVAKCVGVVFAVLLMGMTWMHWRESELYI